MSSEPTKNASLKSAAPKAEVTKKAAVPAAAKPVTAAAAPAPAAKKVVAAAVPAPAAKKVVAKKAAAPKPVVKKVAAKKAATKVAVKKVATKKAAKKRPVTTIIAKLDVGFGNEIFLRGDTAGLSWEKGTLMKCVNADEWTWSSDKVTKSLEFKVLLNDQVWAGGMNGVVLPGATFIYEPSFA